MALLELEKFRQKFPEYSDIDDATLVNKLASKYPQYSDLRDKVGQQPRQTLPKPTSGKNVFSETVKGTASTIGKSAGNIAKGAYQMVRHPIQTTAGLANIALGAEQANPLSIGGALLRRLPESENRAQAFSGAVDTYKQRYGGVENIAKTVATDPFGFVGDVAGAAGLAGGLRPKNFPMTSKGIQTTGNVISGAAKSVGQPIAKVVSAPIKYAKDLIETPGKAKKLAKETIFDIEQKTTNMIRAVERKTVNKEKILSKNYSAIEKGYADLDSTLDYLAQKSAQKEVLSLQKELPAHFAKQSEKYGAKLQELIQDKDISIPADKVVSSLEEALINKGVISFNPTTNSLSITKSSLSKAESLIYNAYQNTKNLMDSKPDAIIDATDLIRTNTAIKPKYGKKWSPDEHMQAQVAEKLSQHIDDAIPGIKELKSSFRPYLQWKDRVIKKLKPFSGERETSAATKVVSGLGTKKMSFDDKRMLSELEKQLGRKVGEKVQTLRKGQETAVAKKEAVKAEARQVLDGLKESAKEEVFRLRQAKTLDTKAINDSVDKIASEYFKKRAVAGVVGGAVAAPLLKGTFLKYFLRRELFNALRGKEL